MDTSAIIAALRDRAKKFVSLETPQDQDLGDVAVDVGAGFIPGVGTVQSARDLERARREGDGLGIGLAGLGLIPFVGGMTKAAGALRKGAKAADKTAGALRTYPRSEALETARQNAVKMLGLPETNTAMDRAKALGFVDDGYHGTLSPDYILEHGFSKREVDGRSFKPTFTSNTPEAANTYATDFERVTDGTGAAVFPLKVRLGQSKEADWGGAKYSDVGNKVWRDIFAAQRNGFDSYVAKNIKDPFHSDAKVLPHDVRATFSPSQVRSRFAAFDPARINDNDLLGAATPAMMATLAGGAIATAATARALREPKKDEKKKGLSQNEER
jgi:hypothetical protein